MPAQPPTSPRPAAADNVARRARNMGTTLVLEGRWEIRGETGLARMTGTDGWEAADHCPIIPQKLESGNRCARGKRGSREASWAPGEPVRTGTIRARIAARISQALAVGVVAARWQVTSR